ncbi:MAG: hypothetical protein MZU97_18720 [Bacillus subtilis]|nr:hypothetical protein [Bacillus subtilis]
MVRDERVSVFLQDDFITTRSGPVGHSRQDGLKGQIPGVVHDVSKSGETAFVEPLAVINLSNELENLIAGRRPMRSGSSGPSRLKSGPWSMRSTPSSALSSSSMCSTPSRSSPICSIWTFPSSARTTFSGSQRRAIPFLSGLSGSAGHRPMSSPSMCPSAATRTVMIITGSNAGGKTIAIKTIGLLTAMALTGMPVPADSSSTFPLRKPSCRHRRRAVHREQPLHLRGPRGKHHGDP